MSDIDALLDSTLDDLEDLPEFKPFPSGAHQVLVTLSMKEVNGSQCVEMEMKAIATLELADPSDEPLKEGDTANVLFMLDNEFGRGALKNIATPIGEALGTGVIREVIEQANDIECVVETSLRKDKKDPDRFYTNVKGLQVV